MTYSVKTTNIYNDAENLTQAMFKMKNNFFLDRQKKKLNNILK